MLVMLLLLLLLSLQGTGWLLLAMAGRTAENRIPASVAATMLLGRLKELSGCSLSSSETMKYICECIINRVINVSCIALTLCSTSWAKLWRDPKLACCPG
jgi:hypothetical protein